MAGQVSVDLSPIVALIQALAEPRENQKLRAAQEIIRAISKDPQLAQFPETFMHVPSTSRSIFRGERPEPALTPPGATWLPRGAPGPEGEFGPTVGGGLKGRLLMPEGGVKMPQVPFQPKMTPEEAAEYTKLLPEKEQQRMAEYELRTGVNAPRSTVVQPNAADVRIREENAAKAAALEQAQDVFTKHLEAVMQDPQYSHLSRDQQKDIAYDRMPVKDSMTLGSSGYLKGAKLDLSQQIAQREADEAKERRKLTERRLKYQEDREKHLDTSRKSAVEARDENDFNKRLEASYLNYQKLHQRSFEDYIFTRDKLTGSQLQEVYPNGPPSNTPMSLQEWSINTDAGKSFRDVAERRGFRNTILNSPGLNLPPSAIQGQGFPSSSSIGPPGSYTPISPTGRPPVLPQPSLNLAPPPGRGTAPSSVPSPSTEPKTAAILYMVDTPNGRKVYRIPPEKEAAFKTQFPNAVKMGEEKR